MPYTPIVSRVLGLPAHKVEKTIRLLEEGSTIPFIARYRKEMTGSLDEVAIADIHRELKRYKELDKRRETILKTIEEQGKLTDALRDRIGQCWDATELEDIYLPYKPKRKTRAAMAREKGLEPLATALFRQGHMVLDRLLPSFLNDLVADAEAALQGARDIIAEWVAEDEAARSKVRAAFSKAAVLTARVARGKEAEAAKYKDYFEYSERLKDCPSHRLLALRRGEEEGLLRVSIAPDEEEVLHRLESHFVKDRGEAAEQVRLAVKDSYERLLAPSIETEFRNLAKEKADEESIRVFVDNLRQLLLTAPLGQRKVLSIDPGFRTGCKLAVLNQNGDFLQHTTIYPHPPQHGTDAARSTLLEWVDRFEVEAIAIGNGTAGRETFDFCTQIPFQRPVSLFLVNEAGASIYSASEVAREEFPDQDVTVRGAVSIGRRLMDPLAELVKIDPKSIGVGQYQHDVNQSLLKESLDRTVESCVNQVGVNINTASKHLLTYVSGLGPSLAQHIVSYRSANGPFRSRQQLKKVPRMGDKSFEQCAGFLRIRDGEHPLDNTAVHPESYHVVERMARDQGMTVPDLIRNRPLRQQIDLARYVTDKIGMPTLTDILKELDKPGLDPRGEAKPVEFGNVRQMEDLREGMVLPGIVTNITNFGAFVDIGVKQDGLVHVSQLANRFVRNPAEVVKLNQQVSVRVKEVDLTRKRIYLSMKEV